MCSVIYQKFTNDIWCDAKIKKINLKESEKKKKLIAT